MNENGSLVGCALTLNVWCVPGDVQEAAVPAGDRPGRRRPEQAQNRLHDVFKRPVCRHGTDEVVENLAVKHTRRRRNNVAGRERGQVTDHCIGVVHPAIIAASPALMYAGNGGGKIKLGKDPEFESRT
jgi:hypothetical protein